MVKGPIGITETNSINGKNMNPFDRGDIDQIFDVGIKSINAVTSIGRGQRMGIIAGSGVGKSVLLSMITRSAEADVIVVGLIGERGRELASFTKEITASHSKTKSRYCCRSSRQVRFAKDSGSEASDQYC